MKIRDKKIVFSVLGLLLFSLFTSGYVKPVSSQSIIADIITDNSASSREVGNWTFMVYLDADNNLETYGIIDFLEMSAIGSINGVNIVVQFDRIPQYTSSYGNWTDCNRYFITQGQTPTPENAVENLGEVNMGDPNALVNFMVWAVQSYPADHYLLVLWNHGSGWKSAYTEEVKGVCFDDTDGDYLTTDELELALATAEDITGIKLDIIGFDACLMAMIEIAYQIRDYADIIVASEEVEPVDGWPYDAIISDLTSYPTMASSELATEIVVDYMASYSEDDFVIQSAANLGLVTYTKIDDLVSVTSNLAQALLDELSTYENEIIQARQQTEEYFDSTYIDLYDFAQQIHTLVSSANIRAAAEQVMSTLPANIIAEGHEVAHPNSHGLSIHFPQIITEYYPSYEDLAFARDTKWDEFFRALIGANIYDIAVNNTTTSKTVVGEGYSTSVNVTVQNQGVYTETINITIYANTTIIANVEDVTVEGGNFTTITFMWNTSGFAKGNYTIKAYAWPLSGEIDTLDNNCTFAGLVFVTIAGDVTSASGSPDGRVDMRDIGLLCYNFMTTPSHPQWNPNNDINDDGVVNMRDIGIACNNYMIDP